MKASSSRESSSSYISSELSSVSDDESDSGITIDNLHNSVIPGWSEGRGKSTNKRDTKIELATSAAQKMKNLAEKEEGKIEPFFSGTSRSTIAAGAVSMTVLAGGLASIIVGGMGTLQNHDPEPAKHNSLIIAGGIATIVGALSFYFVCSSPEKKGNNQSVTTNVAAALA